VLSRCLYSALSFIIYDHLKHATTIPCKISGTLHTKNNNQWSGVSRSSTYQVAHRAVQLAGMAVDMKRKCADTTGTVSVPYMAGDFQC